MNSRLASTARPLLVCGVAAPLLALAATLGAMAANPAFNLARQYLSELGGASAAVPLIFNVGIFAAGVMAAFAGAGFGLAIVALTNARGSAGLTAALFILAGWGLTQAAIYHWPDKRHLAVNLALGIQLAPLLMLWGLWPLRDAPRLKLFLFAVFAAMGALMVLTKHLLWPSLVNDDNVGWWERAYALILVGWVGVAALCIERRLRQA